MFVLNNKDMWTCSFFIVSHKRLFSRVLVHYWSAGLDMRRVVGREEAKVNADARGAQSGRRRGARRGARRGRARRRVGRARL